MFKLITGQGRKLSSELSEKMSSGIEVIEPTESIVPINIPKVISHDSIDSLERDMNEHIAKDEEEWKILFADRSPKMPTKPHDWRMVLASLKKGATELMGSFINLLEHVSIKTGEYMIYVLRRVAIEYAKHPNLRYVLETVGKDIESTFNAIGRAMFSTDANLLILGRQLNEKIEEYPLGGKNVSAPIHIGEYEG